MAILIASYPHLVRREPKDAQGSGDGRSRAALLVDDWMQAQLDSINAADTIVWRQFSNRRTASKVDASWHVLLADHTFLSKSGNTSTF